MPEDPAVRRTSRKILASPSTLRAHEDLAWLTRDELPRGSRLELELEEAEGDHLGGGGHGDDRRLRRDASGRAPRSRAAPRRGRGGRLPPRPATREALRAVERARRVLAKARYYDEAREFGRIASTTCLKDGRCDFVVVTGGGPGVMEAANRGAFDVGATSLGFSIVLPHEQFPNPYITPGLCIYFHYFATRKMHFLIRARRSSRFGGLRDARRAVPRPSR